MFGKVIDDFLLNLPEFGNVPCSIVLSSRVRRISIRVLPDKTVWLVVPSLSVVPQAKEFLIEQQAYVRKRLKAVADTVVGDESALVNVDYPVLLPLAFLGGNWQVQYEWMPIREIGFEIHRDECRIRIFGSLFHPQPVNQCIGRALIRLASLPLKETLDALARKTGLSYGKVTTRMQRGRWGSCSGNCNISLNAQLLFFSPEIVEYVLIHELCHTVEHNHSPAFWALVGKHCPDYLQRAKRQKEFYLKNRALFTKFIRP